MHHPPSSPPTPTPHSLPPIHPRHDPRPNPTLCLAPTSPSKDVSIFLLLVGLIYGGFASWINAMVPNPPTNTPFEPPFGKMPFFWPLWGLVGDIELDLVEENIQVLLPLPTLLQAIPFPPIDESETVVAGRLSSPRDGFLCSNAQLPTRWPRLCSHARLPPQTPSHPIPCRTRMGCATSSRWSSGSTSSSRRSRSPSILLHPTLIALARHIHTHTILHASL